MLIDSHLHARIDNATAIDQLFRDLDRVGVDKTCIIGLLPKSSTIWNADLSIQIAWVLSQKE